MNHIELGQKGEEIAVTYLVSKGYIIKARNFRWNRGEVDLICESQNRLKIVEVKTRTSNYLGEPYLAVNRSKQRQIIRVANYYIQENKIDKEVEFDVVSIVLNATKTKVEHIENAFYPML
ncbi:MAG: YraN family protein [Crocinitomicaceae bacterium]|nr:YraN family protein [Crocinitomicaceae bacterium]MDG1776218.1 YraN family protein [Crocinitomicaceae bacterium]